MQIVRLIFSLGMDLEKVATFGPGSLVNLLSLNPGMRIGYSERLAMLRPILNRLDQHSLTVASGCAAHERGWIFWLSLNHLRVVDAS